MTDILTSLRGRLLGLDRFGRLVCPAGYVSGGDIGATAGAGITDGVGTVLTASQVRQGSLLKTQIFIDLTGLSSSTTDLDVIGVGTVPAYLTQVTAALHGAPCTGRMICVEVPVGGIADIDLYSATVGTADFDEGIAALTETAHVTAGAAWTAGLEKIFTLGVPADNYLYLTGGAAGTAAPYTAGQFLIELEGYKAP